MKQLKTLMWFAAIVALVVLGGGAYFHLSNSALKAPAKVAQSNLLWYSVGGLEIGVATDPGTPRVGDNRIVAELREPDGDPVSVKIDAYAEMPAMGAMSAMRAPADLRETTLGRYEGSMDLSMRGEWPLTLIFQTPAGQPVRLQFDLATDRAEMPIASGATAIGGATGTAMGGSGMPRYRTGDLIVGIDLDPATARVGDNKIMVEVRDQAGNPVPGIEVDAYAQMQAMGAMAAMRAPARLKEMDPGRYEGTVNLSMRGEWPLTVEIEGAQGGEKRLQFDLATDREGLVIAAGATLVGGAAMPSDEANVITIDNRRRQMIGVKTGTATHRDLVKRIRAVGEVTFDERLLSNVTLKFDGYIGDLKANYVGAAITKNQVLFTVYSPELLAAQQEYLETRKRRPKPGAENTLLRAARQRLALWDMSAGEIKALEQRGAPQDYVAMYAPCSGTLIERNITDGSAARMGETLLVIADLSRVWIEAEVFEADLELVHVGMPATITLPYLPGRTYTELDPNV
jgi:Cu(I)/Ag(I) efflux system membrane fusion protein